MSDEEQPWYRMLIGLLKSPARTERRPPSERQHQQRAPAQPPQPPQRAFPPLIPSASEPMRVVSRTSESSGSSRQSFQEWGHTYSAMTAAELSKLPVVQDTGVKKYWKSEELVPRFAEVDSSAETFVKIPNKFNTFNPSDSSIETLYKNPEKKGSEESKLADLDYTINPASVVTLNPTMNPAKRDPERLLQKEMAEKERFDYFRLPPSQRRVPTALLKPSTSDIKVLNPTADPAKRDPLGNLHQKKKDEKPRYKLNPPKNVTEYHQEREQIIEEEDSPRGQRRGVIPMLSFIEESEESFTASSPAVSGIFPKAIEELPKAARAIPKATGTIPKATGAIPKATGAQQKTTGTIPKAAGAVSKKGGKGSPASAKTTSWDSFDESKPQEKKKGKLDGVLKTLFFRGEKGTYIDHSISTSKALQTSTDDIDTTHTVPLSKTALVDKRSAVVNLKEEAFKTSAEWPSIAKSKTRPKKSTSSECFKTSSTSSDESSKMRPNKSISECSLSRANLVGFRSFDLGINLSLPDRRRMLGGYGYKERSPNTPSQSGSKSSWSPSAAGSSSDLPPTSSSQRCYSRDRRFSASALSPRSSSSFSSEQSFVKTQNSPMRSVPSGTLALRSRKDKFLAMQKKEKAAKKREQDAKKREQDAKKREKDAKKRERDAKKKGPKRD